MEEFLAFEEEEKEERKKLYDVAGVSTENTGKKRTLAFGAAQSIGKKKKDGIRQVTASSLLSTTSPWMEYAAHTFLSPHYVISEQRLAFWKHYMSLHPIVQLHEEIVAFERYISPTSSEMKTRSELLQRIDAVVQDLWPGSKVFSSLIHRFLPLDPFIRSFIFPPLILILW